MVSIQDVLVNVLEHVEHRTSRPGPRLHFKRNQLLTNFLSAELEHFDILIVFLRNLLMKSKEKSEEKPSEIQRKQPKTPKNAPVY